MKRRKKGTGSVVLRADGRWQGRYVRRDGRRHTVYGRTEAEATERMMAAIAGDSTTPVPLREHSATTARRPVIAKVLAEARSRGWDDATLLEVLLAQLASRRVALGIFGPCAYCGTWTAGEVEHRIPVSRGGTNARSNLASSCHACNQDKGELTDSEFLELRHLERTGDLDATVAILSPMHPVVGVA